MAVNDGPAPGPGGLEPVCQPGGSCAGHGGAAPQLGPSLRLHGGRLLGARLPPERLWKHDPPQFSKQPFERGVGHGHPWPALTEGQCEGALRHHLILLSPDPLHPGRGRRETLVWSASWGAGKGKAVSVSGGANEGPSTFVPIASPVTPVNSASDAAAAGFRVSSKVRVPDCGSSGAKGAPTVCRALSRALGTQRPPDKAVPAGGRRRASTGQETTEPTGGSGRQGENRLQAARGGKRRARRG